MRDIVTSQDGVGDGDEQAVRHLGRLRSAAVALVVGIMAAVGTQLATDSPIGFAGIPIAGSLGWILAPRLGGTGSGTVIAILWMAFACTVLGAYTVALVTRTGDLGTVLVIGTFGVLFFGVPAFVLLVVPATAWALITSWLERRAARAA